jgi:hypothetical protein
MKDEAAAGLSRSSYALRGSGGTREGKLWILDDGFWVGGLWRSRCGGPPTRFAAPAGQGKANFGFWMMNFE